jgi:glycosyltransferase involved in cell wall biosynthesis
MLSGYLVAMFSAMYRGIPIVLAERNSPDVYNLTRARKFKFLYFQLMRFASGITVQLDCYIDKYPKFLRKKIKVIYNEILVSPKKLEKKQSEQIFTFGFVGRFSYQKQPLRLLESFSRHVARDSGSRLVFFGKGELESEMRAMIEDYNLETFVRIEPPSKDLEHIYSSFDALCLPSLWEGFPNVAGEAMAYGIPVLGNVNCLGLQEIIEENIGILAEFENENTDGFRNLKQLMSSRPQLSTEIQSHFMTLQNYNFQFLWNEVANDAIKQI